MFKKPHQKMLIEKYRPEKVSDFIFPENVINDIENSQKNLLLAGPWGVGKTAVAKTLAKEKSIPYMYINVSDESSVDILRNKISQFCSSKSMLTDNDAKKLVILDEVEGASGQFIKALRGAIDQFSVNSRFIATTNYPDVLSGPILSRFELIDFAFDEENQKDLKRRYAKYIIEICKNENVKFQKDAIVNLVLGYFPDMRQILIRLDSIINNLKDGEEISVNKVNQSDDYNEIFNILVSKPDPLNNYKKIVTSWGNQVDSILSSIANDFPNWLEKNNPDKLQLLPQIIVTIAEHQEQRSKVIDPIITLLSCVFKIQQIINS